MARPTIPAAVLADRGVPLELLGGQKVAVCYGFRSLAALEERYGSVQACMEAIEKGAEGAAFTSIAGILAAGLLHEVEPHDPANGANGRSLGDPEVLLDYLDSRDLEAYSNAIGEAFERAFPAAPADPTEGETTPATTDTSPGASGTTSPASGSVSPMTSSGA